MKFIQSQALAVDLNQVTVCSSNLAAAADFYQLLGLRLIVDSQPRYLRFECPDGASTFSVHLAEPGTTGSATIVYFECKELDSACEKSFAKGVKFDSGPKDKNWLWREARLCDPDRNLVCLYHAGQNRKYPPWRVK